MKRETLTHWKFDALCEALSLARYEAVGILETLWWWTAEHRDDGRLTGITSRALASVLGWKGDAEALVGALIGAGWLDDDGCLIVHGWADHAPKYVHDRRAKRKARTQRERARTQKTASDSEVSPNVADNRRQSRTIDTRQDETRQDETKRASLSLARPAQKNERASDTETGAVPAAVTEAQGIRVAALGEARRLSDAEARTLRGYVAECFRRGAVPAFLVQWQGFHADDFALSRGCPVSLFLAEPSKYAPKPAPKASADEKRRAVGRPSSDWRVCECGHPAARYHDGGRCKATSCGCEAFRESAEEVTA